MKPKFLNSIFAVVFHRREAIANSAARETAIANAFSETEPMEEAADGWFKVSPYGTFRGKTPGRPQHFTEDAAKRMVAEFNSLRGKLVSMRGVLVSPMEMIVILALDKAGVLSRRVYVDDAEGDNFNASSSHSKI
jgi:hypothetical protein